MSEKQNSNADGYALSVHRWGHVVSPAARRRPEKQIRAYRVGDDSLSTTTPDFSVGGLREHHGFSIGRRQEGGIPHRNPSTVSFSLKDCHRVPPPRRSRPFGSVCQGDLN